MAKSKASKGNTAQSRSQNVRRKVKHASLFERRYPRGPYCLQYSENAWRSAYIERLDDKKISHILAVNCKNIEDQILALRCFTIDPENFNKRKEFTRCLLDCLHKHHGVIYEGVIFGSSVNGMGFLDSDIDLRLRPLEQISEDELEPKTYDQDMVHWALRNIAFETDRCHPAVGKFVPSSRCPIAKLQFMSPKDLQGWKYDISLVTSPLCCLNSYYLRFLCRLEPKFQCLAITLRYWARVHDLVQSGYFSSYALINMLIFFCQNLNPPLLPTVDRMRDKYLESNDLRMEKLASSKSEGPSEQVTNALTQLEWQCLINLNEDSYTRSKNSEPMCLLLLKFFHFYLNLSYSKNIINTRTGRLISFGDFAKSELYQKQFPLKSYLNIQDPFDLKHNLTSGMTGKHFMLIMLTMRYSYEKLANEIHRFKVPSDLKRGGRDHSHGSMFWGLNTILRPLTKEERSDFF